MTNLRRVTILTPLLKSVTARGSTQNTLVSVYEKKN